MIGTLAVDGRVVVHLVPRGGSLGTLPRLPPRCAKCNDLPINGQYTKLPTRFIMRHTAQTREETEQKSTSVFEIPTKYCRLSLKSGNDNFHSESTVRTESSRYDSCWRPVLRVTVREGSCTDRHVSKTRARTETCKRHDVTDD